MNISGIRSQGGAGVTDGAQTGLVGKRPLVDGAKTARHTARSDGLSPDKGNREFLRPHAATEVLLLEALAECCAREW